MKRAARPLMRHRDRWAAAFVLRHPQVVPPLLRDPKAAGKDIT